MTKRLILDAGLCSMGGLVFGYDLGALSSASQNLRDSFALSPSIFGLTISASLWGTVCGAPLAGALVDRLGRRRLIALCALIYALAAVGMAFSGGSVWPCIPSAAKAPHVLGRLMYGLKPVPFDLTHCLAVPATSGWHSVLLLRFLSGTAIGGFTVGCPLYLAEMAPKDLRGRLVSLFQVQVGIGVVVAFALGALLIRTVPANVYWRWCFGLGALPAGLLFLLLPVLPRNPRQLAAGADEPGVTPIARERLFQRKYRRPLLLATSIAVFNQLSGANILLLYMLEVLASAGLGQLLGHTYTIWISSLSLAFTVVGLNFVDRLGRKPLLVLGSAGMFLCLALLAAAIPHKIQPVFYLGILAAYNLCFAFSQGTVVWVYLSELFSPAVRGAGQGYGATVHWIANAGLIWLFPVLEHAAPALSFYALALLMLVQIGVVWLWYPETKATTLGAAASNPA